MLIFVFQNLYYMKARIGNTVSLFQQFFVTFIQIILNKVLITEKQLRKDKIWHAYKTPQNMANSPQFSYEILINIILSDSLDIYWDL